MIQQYMIGFCHGAIFMGVIAILLLVCVRKP